MYDHFISSSLVFDLNPPWKIACQDVNREGLGDWFFWYKNDLEINMLLSVN
jgi:hypothetical protein